MNLIKIMMRVLLVLVFSILSVVLYAQPFTTFDARSMGMGGSSVASSRLANAAYSNPALISQPIGGNKIQLLLPVIGINFTDPQGLVNDIVAFNDAINSSDFIVALDALESSIGKPLTIHAYGGGALGFAANKFSMVFIYNKQNIFDFRTNMKAVLTDATLEVRGLDFTETGVAIPLYSGDSFKFGITPKIVSVTSYDYQELLVAALVDNKIVRVATGENAHGSNVNIDIGSAYDFKNGFVLGIVARNLNSKQYTTVLGNKIKLEQLVRLGIAYNGSLFSIAADVDLTENTAVAFAEKSKLYTLGAEFNFFDWVAIRLGHQRNVLSKTPEGLSSVGLGFTPFGIGLDVAVIGNVHAIGGSLQLSFTF